MTLTLAEVDWSTACAIIAFCAVGVVAIVCIGGYHDN